MSEGKNWYLCDPKKNKPCRKTDCFLTGGHCSHTTHIEFADLEKEKKLAEIRETILKKKS